MTSSRFSPPRSLLTVYYGLTIFVSAFLLFQIQPLISKYILPWFGGSTAVWTTAMMFFQLLLLGGYAYAHYMSKLSAKIQTRVHLIVIAVMMAWMVAMSFYWQTPITPGPDWKPAPSGFPIGQVLWVLLASVGMPYFLLSTTSSLVQSWFGKIQHKDSPYSFYVLSNTASLLALLGYPVFFEPNLTVKQQAMFWSIGFGIFLLLIGGCAVILLRNVLDKPIKPLEPVVEEPHTHPALLEPDDGPPTRKMYLFWISLAACASVMLLATTNQICQDVASIPFLWVLPLSLYLFSFVIAFNDHQRHFRGLYVILMLVGLGLGLWNLAYGHTMTILFQIVSNSAMLFIVCLLCHSELYLHRPHPRYLTSFYLMLSIGGAAGGIFVNLVAPLIFKDFWEYNLALVYCAVIAIIIAYQSRGAADGVSILLYRLRIPVAVVSLVLAVLIVILPVAWVTYSAVMTRNFYGVVKIRPMVSDNLTGFDLQHGAIVHGTQVLQDPYRSLPTRYFTENSGIGLTLKNYPRLIDGKPIKVGVIGLGVGTLSAYNRPGDQMNFYEIDPNVIDAAWDKRYFTYLSDSKGKVEIIEGDGRLSLEHELQNGGSQQYDVIVFDAFSGDSIPAHLVDEEALQLYLNHLKPNGILAFNVSNRHINMQPVLATLAQHYALESAFIYSDGSDFLGASASWVILTNNKAFLDLPEIAAVRQPLGSLPGFRMWTDNYSNLFQLLY